MNIKQIYAACLWLIWSNLAYGLSDAVVTVESLNVRKAPKGEIVDVVLKEEKVRIVKTIVDTNDGNKEWAQIIYQDTESGGTQFGWVAKRFLAEPFIAQKTTCLGENEGSNVDCLSTTAPDIQCKKNAATNTYTGCNVNIRYELTKIDADEFYKVSCDAVLATKYFGTKHWEDRRESSTVVFNPGNDQIAVQFLLSNELQVDDIRLKHAGCSLSPTLISQTNEK